MTQKSLKVQAMRRFIFTTVLNDAGLLIFDENIVTSGVSSSSQWQRLLAFLGPYCLLTQHHSFIVQTFRLLICPIYKHD